ncbi:MAG: MaoC family dehydratase [Neomegalonema sp.]|nr:MaoC family dehydratase [Neomegalonema sp.]
MAQSRTLYIDELEPGVSRSREKIVTKDDIQSFGHLCGDLNPVHFDEDYAKGTMFGGIVAHGMMSAALFSAVIGQDLPGPGAVYMGQTLRFRGPVRPGDRVCAECSVVEVNREKRRVTLRCEASVDGKVVLEGEALILVPKRPQAIATAQLASEGCTT